MDTCDTCDHYSALLKDSTRSEYHEFKATHSEHLALVESAKVEYDEDKDKSRQDDSYIVLTADLQQVFFTPKITSSASFYLKKVFKL